MKNLIHRKKITKITKRFLTDNFSQSPRSNGTHLSSSQMKLSTVLWLRSIFYVSDYNFYIINSLVDYQIQLAVWKVFLDCVHNQHRQKHSQMGFWGFKYFQMDFLDQFLRGFSFGKGAMVSHLTTPLTIASKHRSLCSKCWKNVSFIRFI